MNYFRITAYNKEQNYSIIMDSYGAFNELWQFSSFLVDKGFSIIAVGNENFFNDGNIPKVEKQTNKMILRAESQGRPTKDGKQISVKVIQLHKKIKAKTVFNNLGFFILQTPRYTEKPPSTGITETATNPLTNLAYLKKSLLSIILCNNFFHFG